MWALFSGGLLTRGSLFALSIAPFITAAIVIQLLEATVPALRQLRRDGVTGQARKKKIVRTVALVIAAVQAVLGAWNLSRGSTDGIRLAVLPDTFPAVAASAVGLFVGYLMCLWLAQVISRYGFGNGVTVILVTSLAATAAPGLRFTLTELPPAHAAIVVSCLLALMGIVAFAHLSYATIPVAVAAVPALAPRQRASLRLKLLGGGVTPLIFASSLLGVVVMVVQRFAPQLASEITNPLSVWHAAVMWVLCAAFARLWARTTQDPVDMTNDLARAGRHVPGLRPGWATAQHLHEHTVVTAWISALVIAPVLFAPVLLGEVFGFPVLTFIGVPLVIMTAALIELHRQAREYLLLDRLPELLSTAERHADAAVAARRSVRAPSS